MEYGSSGLAGRNALSHVEEGIKQETEIVLDHSLMEITALDHGNRQEIVILLNAQVCIYYRLSIFKS